MKKGPQWQTWAFFHFVFHVNNPNEMGMMHLPTGVRRGSVMARRSSRHATPGPGVVSRPVRAGATRLLVEGRLSGIRLKRSPD